MVPHLRKVPMSEEYLSTADVTARFDVPEETVRYWRHIGYGPTAAKLGRHIRYRASDWDTFLASLVDQEQRKRTAAAV
jgi:DNA-binding transcriptional MerR regulator